MSSHLLGAIRVSVDYEPSQPTTVQQKEQLERAIDAAKDKNMRVILVDPAGSQHRRDGRPERRQEVRRVHGARRARRSPRSTDFVIGNEPNLGRFWFPTFNANGTIASATTYEAALAASYDALKAVNPDIDVIGLAVSPKGDDRPGSARNTISPVRFIKAVGDAYRKSGRTKPIMDNVALHPYPFVNTDPPDKGAPWPQRQRRRTSTARSRRSGTASTAPRSRRSRRAACSGRSRALRCSWLLDEAGWQTDTRGLPGYFGSENTPTDRRGDAGAVLQVRSSSATHATTTSPRSSSSTGSTRPTATGCRAA